MQIHCKVWNNVRWRMKHTALTHFNSVTHPKTVNESNEMDHIEHHPASFIPIIRPSTIIDPRFNQHVIYECYKPKNLLEIQNYMRFVLLANPKIDNQFTNITEFEDDEMFAKIKEYYSSEIKLNLSDRIGK